MKMATTWSGALALAALISLPLQAAEPVKVGSKIDTEGALLGGGEASLSQHEAADRPFTHASSPARAAARRPAMPHRLPTHKVRAGSR